VLNPTNNNAARIAPSRTLRVITNVIAIKTSAAITAMATGHCQRS